MWTKNRGVLWLSLLLTAGIVLLFVIFPHGRTETGQLEIIGDSQAPADVPFRHSERGSYSRSYQGRQEYAPRATGGTPLPIYEKKDLVVELNSADTAELKRLRGIGSVYAARIVKYRNLIGGYADLEQLKEVYGISDSLYQQLLPHLSLDTAAIRKIAINTDPLEQISRYPLIDKAQAKAIVRYREGGHTFSCAEDLLDIPLLDEKTVYRIAPYLTY